LLGQIQSRCVFLFSSQVRDTKLATVALKTATLEKRPSHDALLPVAELTREHRLVQDVFYLGER
jgi:hypothetical protein